MLRPYIFASAEVKIERDLLAVLGAQRAEDERLVLLGVHREHDALASLGGGAEGGLQSEMSAGICESRYTYLAEVEIEIELALVDLARLDLES